MDAAQIKTILNAIKQKDSDAKAAFQKQQRELEGYADLRDDVMSIIKNSGMSFQEIHARCGPHPHTLENWARKDISKPQIGKMRAALRVVGYDFGIIERRFTNVISLENKREAK
jgi:hypothetical protein